MSREKQISEMAKIICNKANELNKNWYEYSPIFEQPSEIYAAELYNAGYRKQSENTVEIVRCKECRNCEKVPSILGTVLYCNEWCKDVAEDTFCSFGAKMKGGVE